MKKIDFANKTVEQLTSENGENQEIFSCNKVEKLANSLVYKTKSEGFFEALKLASESKHDVLIIIKGYPDPDSIAASLIFQYIASHYKIISSILHFAQISHQENQVLVKKLGIKLIQYTENFDFSPYKYLVFNDTQTTLLSLPEHVVHNLIPLILVDHHKNSNESNVVFSDVRESAGSTCSIYVEYLINGPIHLKTGDSESTKMATALMHGIRSDTDNFLLAQEIDFVAAGYLVHFYDRDFLELISQGQISAKTMDITQIAMENKNIQGTYLFSGVGFVRSEDRDCITQVADYLLKREGVETVIVYAIVGEKYIDGSLRTKSHTLDPDKWLKDLFGVNESGKPYGGGRNDKGGFQLPLGVFAGCRDKELLWTFTQNTVMDLLHKKIGADPFQGMKRTKDSAIMTVKPS